MTRQPDRSYQHRKPRDALVHRNRQRSLFFKLLHTNIVALQYLRIYSSGSTPLGVTLFMSRSNWILGVKYIGLTVR